MVSKDQLDILNSLRQSVDAEKSEITNENVELKNSIKKLELHDKEMLEKMNKILIDKVDNKELEKAGMTDQDKNYMSQLLGEINKPSDREHILNESLLEANNKIIKKDEEISNLNTIIKEIKRLHYIEKRMMFANYHAVGYSVSQDKDRPLSERNSWLGLQRAHVSIHFNKQMYCY